MKTSDLIEYLNSQNISTWFDLGLFLDRIKEGFDLSERGGKTTYNEFKSFISEGSMAFITFHYMVDGVTVEVGKYAELMEKNFPGMPLHYIAGKFRSKSNTVIKEKYHKHIIPELAGFGEWDLYEKMFLTELERGSKEYNSLIIQLWQQTLLIIEKLGRYIEDQNIRFLYLVNICSNPGNVSAALATVLISEFLEIPVINNNHDFYFEGGNSRFDIKSKKLKHGPRDFFFTNAHLGEVFSIIEILYPWESSLWINVNINKAQSDSLIKEKGHNPASVMEIGTAVNMSVFTKIDKRRSINAFLQFENILARYKKQLIAYSVRDVEKGELVSEKNPKPILIGNKTAPVKKFISENIIFLQPTRIISRKRIELGFNLLSQMFSSETIKARFLHTPNLKITLLISGPIATGHYTYFKKLLFKFKEFLLEIPEEYRNRVYMALLLGELDRDSFIKRFEHPIGIPELYNISSLILLPSKTEGRGLPIIEATACGTPIFCRRYDPEEVYKEVIGEHLREKDRLKVFEFSGKNISSRVVEEIVERVFFPHNYAHETLHNKKVVQRRYSLDSLQKNLKEILLKLHDQIQPKYQERILCERMLSEYTDKVNYRNKDLDFLIQREHRHYLPGYGRLSYMLMLKSLIDPSYFRMEQQKVRGMVFFFARTIIANDPDLEYIPAEKIASFYHAVNKIFHICDGEHEIRHDHSMSYRHRNNNRYPYQYFTFQELTGVVNLLYLNIVQPLPQVKVDLSPQFFTDWNLALSQLTISNYLAIDNREKLIEKLHENLPIAYFPGEYIMYELEFFALQAMRSRLGLPIEEEVDRDLLEERAKDIAPVYIFAQEKKLGRQLNKEEICNYIKEGKSEELKLLHEFELIQIISTEQLCVGIHFPQLGEVPLSILRNIREQGGFLLTNRRHAALMTDIVNIDRFHIGKVRNEFISNVLGIPVGSGYIQYVPAGIRTTLAYPTPVQNAKDFDKALSSDLFHALLQELGEETVLKGLQEDADKNGSPVMHVLQKLSKSRTEIKEDVLHEYVSGVYEDGNPYNGVIARIHLNKGHWSFKALSTKDKPGTVSKLVEEFETGTGKDVAIAWNGGYILNPELVGKLGLPESYIGSPLGMLISDGECMSPPLFNKAALLFMKNGKAEIRKVNCSQGLKVYGREWGHTLLPSAYNNINVQPGIMYYDLLYEEEEIPGDGRVIVRLSGCTVKDIYLTKKGEKVKIIPVGITLSFPAETMPVNLQLEEELTIEVSGFEDVLHAIEAGPMLLSGGDVAINMEEEGWKTKHSIATQAARLDYTDMRGPKIAVGMNKDGELAVLTINGRIRESVGATHTDMAEILKKYGMHDAMGFDPGGSSTLVVNGKTLNISPYNSRYEYNVYALPPESRAVSNAVVGWLEEKDITD